MIWLPLALGVGVLALAAGGGVATRFSPVGPSGRAQPVHHPKLTSPFGMRIHPTLQVPKLHQGLDLAAAQGTPVWAVEGGTVSRIDRAGVGQGETNGNAVLIRSRSGTWAYLHLHQLPLVQAGHQVQAGQLLGFVGSTGRSSGPHLHLALLTSAGPVDPWPIIGPLYGGSISGDDAPPSCRAVCFGEDL